MPNARPLTSFVAALAFSLATAFGPAHAEDIDIYSLPSNEGFRPNVLIILDNSANWSCLDLNSNLHCRNCARCAAGEEIQP